MAPNYKRVPAFARSTANKAKKETDFEITLAAAVSAASDCFNALVEAERSHFEYNDDTENEVSISRFNLDGTWDPSRSHLYLSDLMCYVAAKNYTNDALYGC
ncbi:hypothetical protein N7452_001536 [Penicillium brevicompactum]|uniref:Uncharacterized protein n=1 Tax=Penicillium brevicompactum TaxID=5074 RepID=A0A9W9R2J2_PENBR|nr:hypothetical protein N7452_001536 [Penicillium brevicompactum]